MNDIKLLGRLTADPDVRSGAKGRSYALFTLAVPRRNKDDGADFVRCMAFDKLADALGKYCQKGRQLLLDGRLEVSTADKDGQTTYYHTVIANHVDFMHDPHRNNQQGQPAQQQQQPAPAYQAAPMGYQQPPMYGQPQAPMGAPLAGQGVPF